MTHTYGPHEPDADQRVVVVLGPERYPAERETALPPLLREQRRQINDLAHAP